MASFQIKILISIICFTTQILAQQTCSSTTNYGNSIDLCKCPPTSSLINGQCKTCQVSNCILCSLDNYKECDVCKTGYVLDSLTKSECVPVQNNILSCTSKACSCSVYEVYKDGYCQSCQVKNCLLCSINDTTQCDVCQKGYVLDQLTQTQCVPKKNASLLCSQSSSSCSCSPYQVNVNGVCTNCAVSNCLLCSTSSVNQCDICKSGYILDSLTKSICVPSSNSTLSCSSSSSYCGCSSVYQVNINGLCTPCQVSNCKLCAIANPYECDICNSDYALDKLTKTQCMLKTNSALTCNTNDSRCYCSPYSVQNSNGSCSACEVSNCVLCSWNNSKECDICKAGYILDKLSKSICVLPKPSVISCVQNSTLCKCSPFQLNIDGVCTTCKAKNCRLCSPTDPNDCDVCLSNYVYNSASKDCDPPVCNLQNQIWINNKCDCNTTISFKNDQGVCELFNYRDKLALAFSVGTPLVLASIGIIIATYIVSQRQLPLPPSPQVQGVIQASANPFADRHQVGIAV